METVASSSSCHRECTCEISSLMRVSVYGRFEEWNKLSRATFRFLQFEGEKMYFTASRPKLNYLDFHLGAPHG